MKILCVLYDDPKEGMPNKYALDSIYNKGSATGGSEEAAKYKK